MPYYKANYCHIFILLVSVACMLNFFLFAAIEYVNVSVVDVLQIVVVTCLAENSTSSNISYQFLTNKGK